MSEIIVLNEKTASQIAAGEVVERPASVVKELVENAIDADASRVELSIVRGGLELVRVVDNGLGMSSHELSLAVKRHATSKLRSAEDLLTVKTLGFRGEALPSIASVSRMRITSRRNNDLAGSVLEMHGGETVKHKEAASPVGTEICVEDLFYNTPARLKFVKSEAAESARITDTVQRLALARPDVAFTYNANNKKVLATSGSGDLGEVLSEIYGRQNFRHFFPVSRQGTLFSLSGYLSRPSLTRANRSLQSFYINKRYIRSYLLSDALQTAYQSLIPARRFPGAVLFLELNDGEVDVNVHPAKLEVRFSQEREVYRQFLSAIRQVLQKESLMGEINSFSRPDRYMQRTASASKNEKLFSLREGEREQDNNKHIFAVSEEISACRDSADKESLQADGENKNQFPSLRPLGQYRGTYVLAQSVEGDLYLVDQHAAHERILYDMLVDEIDKGEMPVQQIMPFSLELDSVSTAFIQENLEKFAELGLSFEKFGNNTFVLRTVPLFFHETLQNNDLQEIVEELVQNGDKSSLQREALKMIACKASLKANSNMPPAEAVSLLKRLSTTQQPFTCPHGRPTVLKLAAETVDKHFRRQ